jgi:hypothetical protein
MYTYRDVSIIDVVATEDHKRRAGRGSFNKYRDKSTLIACCAPVLRIADY